MNVFVVGLSHRSAPVELLERAAVAADEIPKLLDEMLRGSHVTEVMMLSTCNRIEVYAVVDAFHGALTDIGDLRGEDPAFAPVVKFMNRYRTKPLRMVDRMFQSCGVYEPLIVFNRSMVPVFTETGMTVNYVESRDGHSWESWRDRLRDGLCWIFPGESLYVYE